jgi:hypothetical protein
VPVAATSESASRRCSREYPSLKLRRLSCSWRLDDHELTIAACSSLPESWFGNVLPKFREDKTQPYPRCQIFSTVRVAPDCTEAFRILLITGSFLDKHVSPLMCSRGSTDRRSFLPVAPPEDPCDTAGPGPHVSEVAFVSTLWCGAQ